MGMEIRLSLTLLTLATLAHAEPAPMIPAAHIPVILAAAAEQRVDPALLAATAAWESAFRAGPLFRAEHHLQQVLWRSHRGGALRWVADGSIGPCQILRSNFLAFGVDNDDDASSLAVNYRIAAQILRTNMKAFRGSADRAVTAYNIGVAAARRGGEAPGAYTSTILRWSKTYRAFFGDGQPVVSGLAAMYRDLGRRWRGATITLSKLATPAAPVAQENPISRQATRGARRRRKADVPVWVAFLVDQPY